MKKLRKMLGDVHSQPCKDMMLLIESQSIPTLSRWALSYAEELCLPLLRKHEGADTPAECAPEAVRQHLDNALSVKDLRPVLKHAREYAAGLSHPVSLAAGRALATACAVCLTPTNALGFLFYVCAACAYDTLGTEASAQEYDAFANDQFIRAKASLLHVAVASEPNKVKINWNC